MATDEEIERRVAETDTPRTAKRSSAAKRVGELARRRSTIATQLDDIERQLGQVLLDAEDVIDVEELARFTDVPTVDLTRWRTAAARNTRKTPAKRKRSSAGTSSVDRGTHSDSGSAKTPTADRPSTSPEPGKPRVGAAEHAPAVARLAWHDSTDPRRPA